MSAEYGENYPYLKDSLKNWQKPTYRLWWLMRAFLEVTQPTQLEKRSKILSLGGGMGQLEYCLELLGHKVTVVDFNAPSVFAGHQLFPKINFITASGSRLPLKDKTFDLVLSYDLMEHLPNVQVAEQTLMEAERVLKPSQKIKMLHKITVLEEPAIDADLTHNIKWSADTWKDWFEEKGWITKKPTTHKIPIFSRHQIGLYPVYGGFYLSKVASSADLQAV